MKILVTGGAGFIGSNVVENYVKSGHEVIVVDNLSSGKIENIPSGVSFYPVDVRADELEEIIAVHQPDIVNHHAAQKSVLASIKDPLLDTDINLIGMIKLLNASVKHGVKKFIFASSGGALSGDASQIPTPESWVPSFSSPYAINKYVCERYLALFSDLYGLDFTVLRYANVYGPRQDTAGESGVVSIFIQNILNHVPSSIFTDLTMPRGTARDYVYVDDVAQANTLALSRGNLEILNIGSGREVYTADLYFKLEGIMETHIPPTYSERPVGDVARSCLDSTRVRDVLGWEPVVDLMQGLVRTVTYYKDIHFRSRARERN
ncbi:NAD-dependent epimerase/dehydratase family protein [Alicyclobacillus mengziensis]|uniref:NAD-dependent epimerase/dehydratase family protein n=1 Tax=Alicyclobacillus mengziensis TaxID=2931921 RepID=A0A9X7VVI6_9BACL|nr:NAD-dependent epimerase/dehydratase family protein [Alicyclobacillus mengziensis]QSO45374.1 NAD-dependent epimerase/dehydratase family protein [Alicyclobacillus mengziensis]